MRTYRVVAYIRVTEPGDALFDDLEEALDERDHLAMVQPENIYHVEEADGLGNPVLAFEQDRCPRIP